MRDQPSRAPSGDRRERARRVTAARIQAVALDLFERHGFTAVTVEEVAGQADVSPMTVYRHFGTKEGLVLHDEIGAGLHDAVGARVAAGVPLIDAVADALGAVDDEAAAALEERARSRIRLTATVPTLAGAAHVQARAAADHLVALLVEHQTTEPLPARVTALAVLAALEAAADHWYATNGAEPLRTVSVAALRALPKR